MPRPILFALTKLSQPPLMQQRMRAFQGGLPPKLPVNCPWNATSSRVPGDVATLTPPTVVHQLLPYPPTYFRLTGTTKDLTGAPLGSCTVDWFNTADDVRIDTTTSDATGAFEFRTAGQPPNAYYLVAYKAGSTDVFGTTINTLVGT